MSESAIHDLGYKRYVGARQEASTRWRVIMRHQIASGWSSFWRFKAWLIATVIVVVIAAVFIFIATDKLVHMGHGISERMADVALPLAFDLCGKIAFIVSLCIGANIIAGDMQSGAFVFYFARSTRPLDYLLGKLTGYGVLVGIIYIGGPFVVALMRVGLAGVDDVSQLLPRLWLLPETLAIGLAGTIVYTAIPLAFSAMIANKRYALGVWGAWYIIGGMVVVGIGVVTHSPISSIDISTSLKVLTADMPDIPGSPLAGSGGMLGLSAVACVISLAVQTVLAIGLIYFQLSHAQRSGVGGAT